jgi:hypothetical protein
MTHDSGGSAMTNIRNPDRRTILSAFAATLATLTGLPALAQGALPNIAVTKDPSCGCCGNWVRHLKQAGFPVEVTESSDVNRLKVRLGVPKALASCHTAEVDAYVVEGHVPASAIKRLLAERPRGRGLAVAGMPVGSPGMEVEGMAPENYEVVLFGPEGQRTFARYLGVEEV